MICEIISVGTELLLGQIVNSDAKYLAEQMSRLGISLYHITTVGDNPGRLNGALKVALGRSDLVITTGGLGPTEDDITKECAAEVMGLPMKVDSRSLKHITDCASDGGYELTEISKKQAEFPEGSRIMPNRVGTAPGCIIEQDGKIIAVLPGPPRELIDMYEHALEPFLQQKCETKIVSRYLKIFGMHEPEVQQKLIDLFHLDNPTLALYCGDGEVMARVTTRCGAGVNPNRVLDPVEKEIRLRLGDAVYGEGKEMTLQQAVFDLMLKRGKLLALAESCTGGMLGSLMTECRGASRVLLEGHVTYNDLAKIRVLGVRNDTMATYGAVSPECASEMAAGVLMISNADYALSITGIAGPDGGTPLKPVGTCHVGIASKKGVTSKAFLFEHMDRTQIRVMCCKHALNILRLKLLAND